MFSNYKYACQVHYVTSSCHITPEDMEVHPYCKSVLRKCNRRKETCLQTYMGAPFVCVSCWHNTPIIIIVIIIIILKWFIHNFSRSRLGKRDNSPGILTVCRVRLFSFCPVSKIFKNLSLQTCKFSTSSDFTDKNDTRNEVTKRITRRCFSYMWMELRLLPQDKSVGSRYLRKANLV
jgi:hypothetical protein